MDQNTIVVSPMSQFISLEPGQTYSGAITVANPSDATSDVTYSASVKPYNVTDQAYTADLATMSNYSELVNWLTMDSPTGTLSPNSTAEIPFSITVPANAPAGGQYATIVVSQAPSTTDNNTVSSVVGLASLIYADIAGETTHAGEVLDTTLPGFSLVTPVSITTTITNTGNVHDTAYIDLTVTNTFTGEKIFPTSEDSSTFSEVIMPDSTRLIVRELTGLPSLGIVRIDQTITYQGVDSTFSQTLVLCPIWFIALVAFTIFSIFFALIFRARSHRKTSQSSI